MLSGRFSWKYQGTADSAYHFSESVYKETRVCRNWSSRSWDWPQSILIILILKIGVLFIVTFFFFQLILLTATRISSSSKEVVFSKKPLISEETYFFRPILLDEQIGHVVSLASVTHKPLNAFAEWSHDTHYKHAHLSWLHWCRWQPWFHCHCNQLEQP